MTRSTRSYVQLALMVTMRSISRVRLQLFSLLRPLTEDPPHRVVHGMQALRFRSATNTHPFTDGDIISISISIVDCIP
jgi:hypothetical protein